jgi:hypothetical protein
MSKLEHTEMTTSNEIMNYSLIPGEHCRDSEAPQPQIAKPKNDIKSQEMQELNHQELLVDMRERHHALNQESQNFMKSLDDLKSSIDAILKRNEPLSSNHTSQQHQQNIQSAEVQRNPVDDPQSASAKAKSAANAEAAQDGKQADDEYTAHVKFRVPIDPEVELQLFIAASQIRLAIDKGLLKESKNLIASERFEKYQLTTANADLQMRINDLERKNLDLQKKNDDQELDLATLSRSLDAAESKLSAQESEMAKLITTNADLQQQNLELVAGQNAMAPEIAQLKKDLLIQSDLRAEYFQENKRLEMELEEYRTEVESLGRKRKEKCRKLEE